MCFMFVALIAVMISFNILPNTLSYEIMGNSTPAISGLMSST